MELYNCGVVFINKCTFGWFFGKSHNCSLGVEGKCTFGWVFLAKVTVVP